MRRFKKYLITLLADLAGVLLIIHSKDIWTQTSPVEIYHILCDAFFVVGVVTTCGGLLVFSTNEGTFDMLSYGMQSFMDIFRREKRLKYDTFYDYRMSRMDKKVPFGFLLIFGVVFIAISMVMLYCYHNIRG